MNKVAVIIPAWNLWELTLPCLESLAEHSPEHALEVIVVDNGSTDATATALAPTLARLFGEDGKALRLPENRGFARACNAGAASANAPLLFFLNNDTLVSKDWLPPLLEALALSPRTGMVGPLLLYPGGKVQHCGICFAPTLEMGHLYSFFPGSHPLAHKSRPLQAITGAAFLLSAELFRQCGGLHEGYVNGFEDLDLCCAVRERGLNLVCAPKSRITHITSQTPGRFDHDTPNTRLLNARRPGGFMPDLHRLGAADGFVPQLSPALELYLTLAPAKEEALTTAFSSTFQEDRCRARLEAEPLWQGGYTLLARHYQAHNLWEDAVDALSSMVHFFPLPEHAAALARAAARNGDATLAAQAGQAAQDLLRTAADIDALHRKATALGTWAGEVGDEALAALFAQWRKK